MGVTATTHACRGAAVALAAWVGLQPARADAAVQRAWDVMRSSAWVRHETFEPTLVVAVFALSIGLFFLLDVPLKRLTSAWRAPICASDDMRAWRWEGGQRLTRETAIYVLPLLAYDRVFPRRVLPAEAPGAARLAAEVLLALVLYDLFFTAGHVACHRLPRLYRATHAKHHREAAVRAVETICLTPWEEALDVGCSILALNVLRAHPMSRAVYNAVIVYLLTELHSGYELPWMLQDVVPGGLWAGSRRHALHHRHGNVCFQKFFTYLDAAMGTGPRAPTAAAGGERHKG
mmetsp:Transcript_7918/g.23862  ORF Transcript_7918/g.23862 Transcript_7918/m.23862 type:complete len:290 (+) Transcript_7918:1403-2272(+)|eukprot:238029-Chlamydomonas_euryale.AAC.3